VHEQELIRSTDAEKNDQIQHVRGFQATHAEESGPALERLQSVARERGNVFAELMQTVKSNSLGQVSNSLYHVGPEGKIMRVLVVVLFALAPALSSAQSAQSWDFSIGAIYQDSLSVGGEGGPETPTPDTSSLSVKSELGFTANFTYNINEHFAVGLDIDYLKPDYTAILVSEDPADADVRIDHSLTQWNGRLKGTWNITEGPLVPYVDFGYGWTNIDAPVVGLYLRELLQYLQCNRDELGRRRRPALQPA